MLEEKRHQLLLEILTKTEFASVPEISAQLEISESTIRRDIVKLARQGQLRKIRGGAQVCVGAKAGAAFLINREQNADTQRRIAKKAVELCEDGESIIINGGSATQMMGEFLAKRHLNIVTNSFYLAQELMENSDNQITVPGGEIYRRQGIILSSFENDTIQNHRGTKMFMGTPGIGEYGVMESDPLLIRAEQKLLKQADKLIILADSSKLGKYSNFIFEPLDTVDILITDREADETHINLFKKAGIEVIQV